jgi:hypothetical protein
MIKIFVCIASASVVVATMACSRPKDIVIAFDEDKASQQAIENLNCTPAAGKACITEAREDGISISHRLEAAFAREPECKGIRLAVDRDGKSRSKESLRGQVWTLSLDIRPRMDDHLLHCHRSGKQVLRGKWRSIYDCTFHVRASSPQLHPGRVVVVALSDLLVHATTVH